MNEVKNGSIYQEKQINTMEKITYIEQKALVIISNKHMKFYNSSSIIEGEFCYTVQIHLEDIVNSNTIALLSKLKKYKKIHVLLIIETTPTKPYSLLFTKITIEILFNFIEDINRDAEYVILSASCFGLLKHRYFPFLNKSILITISDYYQNTQEYASLFNLSKSFISFSDLLFKYHKHKSFCYSSIFISYYKNNNIKTISIYEYLSNPSHPNYICDLYLNKDLYTKKQLINRLFDFYSFKTKKQISDNIELIFSNIEKFVYKYHVLSKHKNTLLIAQELNRIQNIEERKDYFDSIYNNNPFKGPGFESEYILKYSEPRYYKELINYLDSENNIIITLEKL
jgi:hypothetical protein